MGRLEAVATKHDLYFALALTVRDRLFHRSLASIEPKVAAPGLATLTMVFKLGLEAQKHWRRPRDSN